MIYPTNSNIFVKLLHREEVAGLIIPDKAKRWQEKMIECEVEAIGPFVRDVAVGEIVVIEGSAGKWIDGDICPFPTETYRMIDQSEVLLVKEAA